ncbi:hypothetical protein D3C85_1881950 [compost metagenome]
MTSEPRPVRVTIGLALVLKPSLRSTSMPGMYCPVSVMTKSGSATPSREPTEKRGISKTGAARLR